MNQNNQNLDALMKERVANLIYAIRTGINSIGMIVGAITLSLVDVILGGFVLSNMLRDSMDFELFGFPISGSAIGWMLSFVFWYVQLVLWDYILQDNKITKSDIPALALSIVIAVIDTFGDSSSVLIGTKNSGMRAYLDGLQFLGIGNLFDMIVNSLFVATVIVTGFNEFLNRLLTRNANIIFQNRKMNYNHNPFFSNPPKPSVPVQSNPKGMRKIDQILQGVKRKP